MNQSSELMRKESIQKSVSKEQLSIQAPIIVGGIGGSGTRAVVLLLERMGIYMGDYRSVELDSGYFGRLVARYPPLWKEDEKTLKSRLHLIGKLHLGKVLSPGQVITLFLRLGLPLRDSVLLLRRAYSNHKDPGRFKGWGFKHPCTHFFLPQLAYAFPQSRYLHVMRHGLDMAFSKKNYQFLSWGKDFDIQVTPETITEVKRVDFWIRVNTWVLKQCKTYYPGQHYVINFDSLCREPEKEVQKLVDFLGITPTSSVSELAQLIKTPESVGQYRIHLTKFTPAQIQAVKDFGYEVA